MNLSKINFWFWFWFWFGGTDIAGNIQIVPVLADFIHRDAAGISIFIVAPSVSGNDFLDILTPQIILSLPFLIVFAGVDKQDIIEPFALL